MPNPTTFGIDPYYDSPEWRNLRAKVLKRDQHICRYCHGIAHQADHVIPRKYGGKDILKNLVACCSTCNRTAGNLQFESVNDKQKWILANRLPEDARPLRNGKPSSWPTTPPLPRNPKSLFRRKLEEHAKH